MKKVRVALVLSEDEHRLLKAMLAEKGTNFQAELSAWKDAALKGTLAGEDREERDVRAWLEKFRAILHAEKAGDLDETQTQVVKSLKNWMNLLVKPR